MVGDLQQSIFGQRADLGRYRAFHERLTSNGAGKALEFTTTFRCDQSIVDFVNATFPEVFSSQGQVDFVALRSRPDAGTGQVLRWAPKLPGDFDPEIQDYKKGAIEATQLAAWLKQNGVGKLRARSWSNVVIICPMKRWFGTIVRALAREGLAGQVQSERDQKGSRAAYAWLTALLVAIVEPANAYEIVGVLREIFGTADDDLADFVARGGKFSFEEGTAHAGEIGAILRSLGEAHRRARELPLRDAVEFLIERFFLRERLRQLPADVAEAADAEIGELLVLAANAEAGGASLFEWAEELSRNYSVPRDVQPVRKNAVQIITAHKAKGLQWDAVVLPFFGRRQYFGSSRYPRLVSVGASKEPRAVLRSDDIDEELKALETSQRAQELERLLYVSLTRAKHTLVLVDDLKLFANKTGEVNHCTMAAQLKVRPFESNVPHFHTLRDELSIDPLLVAGSEMQPRMPRLDFPRPKKLDLEKAKNAAHDFPHRRLPHTFSVSHRGDTTAREEQLLDREPDWPLRMVAGAAAAYGSWWHDMMEKMPWFEGVEAWQQHFAIAQQSSQMKARSAREWNSFIGSELKAALADPALVFHTEFPFLHSNSATECTEGLIDLAAFHPKRERWLIVDWKTDRVELAAVRSLIQTYGAQVRAYGESLGGVTQCPVEATIYSTATGRWLKLDDAAATATAVQGTFEGF